MALSRGEQTRARVLRSQQVTAEAKLWEELRNRQLGGFKFVRQAAVGERRLVVEVDGATHGLDDEIAADTRRTAALERMGYRVCRVTNDDVARNMDGVLDWLLHELDSRS